MISPNDIKTKAERKYFSFLQDVVQAIPFSRIVISGDKTYNKTTVGDFQKEILALVNQSKEKSSRDNSPSFQLSSQNVVMAETV
jgi:glucose-6-phosphate isomerase